MLNSRLLQTMKYFGWFFFIQFAGMLIVEYIIREKAWEHDLLLNPHGLSTATISVMQLLAMLPPVIAAIRVLLKVLYLLGLIKPEDDSWFAAFKIVAFLLIVGMILGAILGVIMGVVFFLS